MEEPILEIDQIQGNIMPGFRLPYQIFIGCKVDTGSLLRQFYEYICPLITTMRDSLAYNSERLEKAKMNNIRGIASFALPQEKNIFWLNIGLGSAILKNVNSDALMADGSFEVGLAGRSFLLGDPMDSADEGHKANWILGGDNNEADILLITGSENNDFLQARCDILKKDIKKFLIKTIYFETAQRLSEDNEHFGFKDGISQPAVRGFTDNKSNYFYPRQIVAGNEHPGSMEFSYPGKPLLWLGQFVFGYPKQSASHFRNPVIPSDIEASQFLKNGSFLVFRRLKQDVKKFNDETKRMYQELTSDPEFKSLTYEEFIAQMVGRNKSGRPVIFNGLSNPNLDFNNFNFKSNTTEFMLTDGTKFVSLPGDPSGEKCPFFAHIRKVNPRDLPTDQGAETNTATFRILRRGIPFGPPYNFSNADDEINQQARGLLFVSYQTSIQNQFELLTIKWMNESNRPEASFGFDMIVGQNNEENENRRKWCILKNNNGEMKRLETISSFVVPTGGGYFFSPSIASLQTILDRLSS